MRMTRTTVNLELSLPAYREILQKLRRAGYDHAISQDCLSVDMNGISVIPNESLPHTIGSPKPWSSYTEADFESALARFLDDEECEIRVGDLFVDGRSIQVCTSTLASGEVMSEFVADIEFFQYFQKVAKAQMLNVQRDAERLCTDLIEHQRNPAAIITYLADMAHRVKLGLKGLSK